MSPTLQRGKKQMETALAMLFGPAAVLISAAAIFGFLMKYLQRGFRHQRGRADPLEKTTTPPYMIIEDYVKKEVRTRYARIENEVSQLKSKIASVDFTAREISDSEKNDLVARVRESIDKVATEELLDKLRSSISDNQALQEWNLELQRGYEQTTQRLHAELADLSRRGNLNLTLGIVSALVGIGLLGYFVLYVETSYNDNSKFALSFAPRLSLVMLIEIFAYFFLRLYSASLSEIKYFQNELTNIETKHLALRSAVREGNQHFVGQVIATLAQTERNYILAKGQSTVELERTKGENETVKSLTREFLKTLSRR